MEYIEIAYKLFEKSNNKDLDSFEFGLKLGLLISQLINYNNMDSEEAKEILRENILSSDEGKLFNLVLSVDKKEISFEKALIKYDK